VEGSVEQMGQVDAMFYLIHWMDLGLPIRTLVRQQGGAIVGPMPLQELGREDDVPQNEEQEQEQEKEQEQEQFESVAVSPSHTAYSESMRLNTMTLFIGKGNFYRA
jgi:hypothetical protein